MKRRNFITNTAAVAALPFIPKTFVNKDTTPEELLKKHLPVNFTRDGLNLSPSLYAAFLEQLIVDKDFKPDSYGLGGMIHQFEEKVAKALGKEKAIYMPTGTLANHIALRKHCIIKKRAIVQYESHINRDSGDCATTLSGINLLTLGRNKLIFDTDELIDILNDSSKGKVKTPIGILSLETPLRRKHLQRIPFEHIKKLSVIARKNSIATHLDGARLYIDAAFSGKKISDYTQLFDTVYLSLYKSFNSISGAILAGPENIINGLHNERRMFGGGLPSSWPQIIIANYFFDNYEDRYQKALDQFNIFKNILEKSGKYQIQTLENGSNVFKLVLAQNMNPDLVREKVIKHKILFPKWDKSDHSFYIKMNDSLVYNDMKIIAGAFL
jgi:threonine aldolase